MNTLAKTESILKTEDYSPKDKPIIISMAEEMKEKGAGQ